MPLPAFPSDLIIPPHRGPVISSASSPIPAPAWLTAATPSDPPVPEVLTQVMSIADRPAIALPPTPEPLAIVPDDVPPPAHPAPKRKPAGGKSARKAARKSAYRAAMAARPAKPVSAQPVSAKPPRRRASRSPVPAVQDPIAPLGGADRLDLVVQSTAGAADTASPLDQPPVAPLSRDQSAQPPAEMSQHHAASVPALHREEFFARFVAAMRQSTRWYEKFIPGARRARETRDQLVHAEARLKAIEAQLAALTQLRERISP